MFCPCAVPVAARNNYENSEEENEEELRYVNFQPSHIKTRQKEQATVMEEHKRNCHIFEVEEDNEGHDRATKIIYYTPL